MLILELNSKIDSLPESPVVGIDLLMPKSENENIGPEGEQKITSNISKYRNSHGYIRYVYIQDEEIIAAIQAYKIGKLVIVTSMFPEDRTIELDKCFDQLIKNEENVKTLKYAKFHVKKFMKR